MKHMINIFVVLSIMIFVLVGCGTSAAPAESVESIASAEPSDVQKAKEAIATYQSYCDEVISSDEAMQKILLLSKDIEDRELATLVANIAPPIALDKKNGSNDAENRVEKVNAYLENGNQKKQEETASVEKEPQDILYDGQKFLNSCWNPIFYLEQYVNRGYDLDVEFTVAKFKEAYKDRDAMIEEVNALPDDYSLAKEAFTKAIDEFDRFSGLLDKAEYIDFINESEASNSTLDVQTLSDYVSTFTDQYNATLN